MQTSSQSVMQFYRHVYVFKGSLKTRTTFGHKIRSGIKMKSDFPSSVAVELYFKNQELNGSYAKISYSSAPD